MDEESVRSYKISTLGGGISHLANGLENCNGMFKVSNMKYWDHKFDIRVMPHAIDGGLSTGFAKCVFVRCALTILKFRIHQCPNAKNIQGDDQELHFSRASDL